MQVLDSRIHDAFRRIMVQKAQGGPCGCIVSLKTGCGAQSFGAKMIHKIDLGDRRFEDCHRADFLDGIISMMPKDTIRFCIDLGAIDQLEDYRRVKLRFLDGSSLDMDVGTACDRCDPESWYVLTRWSAITYRLQRDLVRRVAADIKLGRNKIPR